ncbi:hypothetical protein JZ751_019548 [Albula glossodonta]|uniref:Uncharacterized protein n=1 Tax=Albula glossodonta TaxID=121402 RepID=A0A8T2MYX8_9TELE|nr:hypothetical protein JZ751_019548 [Albula glossodonta]
MPGETLCARGPRLPGRRASGTFSGALGRSRRKRISSHSLMTRRQEEAGFPWHPGGLGFSLMKRRTKLKNSWGSSVSLMKSHPDWSLNGWNYLIGVHHCPSLYIIYMLQCD